jgi:hypothetical protein
MKEMMQWKGEKRPQVMKESPARLDLYQVIYVMNINAPVRCTRDFLGTFLKRRKHI